MSNRWRGLARISGLIPALASAQVQPEAASPVPMVQSSANSATLPPVTVEASARRTPKSRRPHERNSRNIPRSPRTPATANRQPPSSLGALIKTDSLYTLCFPVQTAPTAVCQNGVMDYVLHPIEPLAVRLTLVGSFAEIPRFGPYQDACPPSS